MSRRASENAMSCDEANAALSAAMDTAPGAVERRRLDEHRARCPTCDAYAHHLQRIRRELRFEVVDAVPDVAPAVLDRIRAGRGHGGRQRRVTTAIAVFCAAFLAGAAFVGMNPRGPEQVAAAGLPERIVAAQPDVRSLTAMVHVVERGWHPRVPVRRWSGRLLYAAPESLSLTLTDETPYPSGEWVPNNVSFVVDEDRWWASGPAPCPRESQPSCAAEDPRVRAVSQREPFGEAHPSPLDLVVPVRSFALAADPERLPSRDVGGRPAIGMTVTAAQLTPLLEGLRQAGDWRAIHPSDRVELWAARRGYRDPSGVPAWKSRSTT